MKDAAQPWCPTATYLNGGNVENSWEFCDSNCNLITSNKSEKTICESRNSFHKYLDMFYDKSRTNPRKIAENLKHIGCPFRCQYKEYFSQLVYKKNVPQLGETRVRLVIEFDGKTDVTHITKTHLYTTDMFVSDIGSILGLLLGISLFDLISNIYQNLVIIFTKDKNMDKSTLLHAYLVMQWLSTLCFIARWIYSSQDLVYLLPRTFTDSGDKTILMEDFVGLDKGQVDVGFLKLKGSKYLKTLSVL